MEHISSVAVRVIARVLAKKAESLRAQGIRQVFVRQSAVSAHLEAHPELYEQALAQAWELAVKSQSARINAAIFDDDRRGSWRKPRPRRPVYTSDHAKTPTDNISKIVQPVGD
jgi:hypothetical protein